MITVILPCAGEGTRLSLPYPKEVHSIEKNKSLIDVGCGNGIILSRMSGYFEKLFGVCVTKIISARFIPDLNSLKPPTGKT